MLDPHAFLQLFSEHPQSLGVFCEVPPADLPAEYRRLLVHQQHMTVAMEAFHESLVDLEVLQVHQTEAHYARQILLRRRRDGAVVQFGIMRVALACLSDSIRAEIEARQQPLGRILCLHDVLRNVRLDRLWRIEMGEELCRLFEIDQPRPTYGRTAGIDLHGQAAIEVLEIPAPL